jgi:hypothetical protein
VVINPDSASLTEFCGFGSHGCGTIGVRALLIVKPETVIARDFASIGDGRVGVAKAAHLYSPEVRNLIRQMSLANPRWGAPRIHGELLKIGIEVSQATVAKYMARHGKPPSQTWRTFLRTWGKVIGYLRREFHSSVIV